MSANSNIILIPKLEESTDPKTVGPCILHVETLNKYYQAKSSSVFFKSHSMTLVGLISKASMVQPQKLSSCYNLHEGNN